ncbi:hypothetical protein [Psychromonas arctica]|uniref:hypothetical protein n=1 Tax=Psychromonas arctica TaxID=168275 RepID=UPI002FD53BDD
MQIINMSLVFESMLFSFCWLFFNFVIIFIVHFLMPKDILETYFKKPYFKSSEIITFTGFPFGYVRTLMFMRILGFPISGKKRGLEKVFEISPVWLCNLSKYVIFSFLASFSLWLLLMAIAGVHMMLN